MLNTTRRQVLLGSAASAASTVVPGSASASITNGIEIIGAICAALGAEGFTHSPKLVRRDDFSLLRFIEQPCDIEGVDVEYINQYGGGGMTGDEFRGTAAYPIGDYLFVIEYNT